MKIYTKTGDKGMTSLFGGERVLKSSLRVEAYGCVDELNSLLGVIVASLKVQPLKKELILIQNDLLDIGSALANPKMKRIKLEDRVASFEKIIDQLTQKIPELRNFILPGGGKAGSLLHFSRTVARRTERIIVQLSKKENIDNSILIYFNRLSDLLFTMARYANYKEKKKEIIWQQR